MARIARIVIPGSPHHVVQRGVRSLNIFKDDHDRQKYLELLKISGKRFGLEFWAWCLMNNHVHLLVVPKDKDSRSKGVGDAGVGTGETAWKTALGDVAWLAEGKIQEVNSPCV